ncbi:MAG: YbhB/YbcL family Raf kinase inhibitor-like protein [Thermoplasmatales archaeon]|nr:MAG: YbhB/YbcL family Raf kinase inhibitor-like protein [Thermoplasmatales archaeon]
MKLSSPTFENGGSIPIEHTCDGVDVSPSLIFSELPENAKSLALIMDDPDAPMGTWVHWVIWNIPPNITGFSQGENITFPQGKNDFGKQKYGGPCPPSGTHRYFFKLYALDTMLDLRAGATKRQLEKAMSGHIMVQAELMGTYSR